MAEPLIFESSRPLGDMQRLHITGMSSPIARALMLDRELIETREFHGTASSVQSAEGIASFMEEYDVAGTVTVSSLDQPGAAGEWYEAVSERYGPTTNIAHLAGDAAFGSFEGLDTDDARKAMEVKYFSLVDLAHAAQADLAAAATGGRLVVASTIASTQHALDMQTAYGPANAAANNFAETVHSEAVMDAMATGQQPPQPWVRAVILGAVGEVDKPIEGMFMRLAPPPIKELIIAEGKLVSFDQAAAALRLVMFGEEGAADNPVVAATLGTIEMLNVQFHKNVEVRYEISEDRLAA